MPDYFVSYVGELTADDRQALDRPGWKIYKDGTGFTAGFVGSGEPFPPMKYRQYVRLSATDASEAGEMVVAALGREPDGLRVFEGKADESE